MRVRNALGAVVCAALLGAPAIGQAQDRDTQTPRGGQQPPAQPQQPREGQPPREGQQPAAQQQREGQQRDTAQASQERGQQGASTVEFRELRSDPDQFYGRTVTFEANVDGILGPNVIRLSSTTFWDWFGGDMIAYAPDALGIAVSDRDRVRITGTAERYNEGQVRQHLSWIDPGEDVGDAVRERALVRITQITTEDGRNALVSRDQQQMARGSGGAAVGTVGAQADRDRQQTGVTAGDRDRDRQAVGTSGRTAAISDLDSAFDARRRDVGRSVNLQQVQVERMLGNQFFLAERDGTHILVRLADGVDRQGVQAGQRVSVQGVLMQMPDDVRQMPGVNNEAEIDRVRTDDVYILATNVSSGGAAARPGAQQQGQQPGAQPQPPGQRQPGQPGQPQAQPQGRQPGQQQSEPQRQPGQPQGQTQGQGQGQQR